MNIVCYRYVGAGVPEERLNAINEELLLRIQERGIAIPSSTDSMDDSAFGSVT